jgi:hypothetical protein
LGRFLMGRAKVQIRPTNRSRNRRPAGPENRLSTRVFDTIPETTDLYIPQALIDSA